MNIIILNSVVALFAVNLTSHADEATSKTLDDFDGNQAVGTWIMRQKATSSQVEYPQGGQHRLDALSKKPGRLPSRLPTCEPIRMSQ